MNPLDALDRILALLHQAALDDGHWSAAAAEIDEAVGAVGNGLTVGEGFGDEVRLYFVRFLYRGERRADRVREYFDIYLPRDEGARRLRQLPSGQLLHVPDLYTETELKASAAYNEGARRLNARNGLCVRFDGPDGLRIVWSVGDPVGTDGWQSDRLELVERLLPHIRQCVVVRQALAGADAVGSGLTDLLDNRHIGVFHLDRRGRVVAGNAHGVAILRRGDGLSDRGGSLHAALAEDHDRLERLLARALPGLGSGIPAGGSMTVRGGGGERLSLHVSPVGDAQADFGARRVAALVLVVDPASRPRIDPEWVAAALGLTAAEGRAAALLAEGRSVREVAAAAGHRESYVRALLKQMYKKQGVPGQVALVQRVLAIDVLPRR